MIDWHGWNEKRTLLPRLADFRAVKCIFYVLIENRAGAFSHRKWGQDAAKKATSVTYTPQHIANYFLDAAEAEGSTVDLMKLIKLVYIAYGWVLALTGNKLFDEPVEAWKHGPVVPSIYHEFKHYRSSPICESSGIWDMETNGYQIPKIPKSEKVTQMILEKVWAAYKPFSGWSLRRKTHEAGTPWSVTYDPSIMSKPIPDELIRNHFHIKIREILDAARDRNS